MLPYARLRVEHYVFMHAKVALIVWGVVYCLWPPDYIVEELGSTLVRISAAFAIVGSMVGLAGLIFSQGKTIKRTYQGIIIEFAGLIIALCGPLSYFITAIYVGIGGVFPLGAPHTALSYALAGSLLSRIFLVRRTLRGAADYGGS